MSGAEQVVKTCADIDALTSGKKMASLDFYNLFINNAKLEGHPIQYIEGAACFYNGKYYETYKDKKQLKGDILRIMSQYKPSMSLIDECAKIVEIDEKKLTVAVDQQGWLRFENALYNINTNETIIYHESNCSAPSVPPPGQSIPLTSNSFQSGSNMPPSPNVYQCMLPNQLIVPAEQYISPTPIILPPQNIVTTYSINASWKGPNGECPTPAMDAFLERVTDGNEELINRIWEMIGYLLVPDYDGKAFFVLQGPSNTGKSVLGNFISSLFPSKVVTNLDIDSIGDQRYRSKLKNSRINISMDLPNKNISSKAIGALKQMTGGDATFLDVPYQGASSFRCRCKFLFATNHPLKLQEKDEAFEDRVIVIPFLNPLHISARNPKLLDELMHERDEIVYKAINHYMELRQYNYNFSGADEEICQIQTSYSDHSAELRQLIIEFSKTCCVFSKGAKIHTETLFQAFQEYSEDKYPFEVHPKGFSRAFFSINSGKIKRIKLVLDAVNANGFEGVSLRNNERQGSERRFDL